jgi:hypothetical protein
MAYEQLRVTVKCAELMAARLDQLGEELRGRAAAAAAAVIAAVVASAPRPSSSRCHRVVAPALARAPPPRAGKRGRAAAPCGYKASERTEEPR